MVFSRNIGCDSSTRKSKELILNSGLFDAAWYSAQQGLRGGAGKALTHFLKSKVMHDPSVRFSSRAYLFDNRDVRDAGLNPLLHYLQFGKEEGRIVKDVYGQISGVAEPLEGQAMARLREWFDEEFYQDANPDLQNEDDLFEHFMRVGWRQNRDPAPWFSLEEYLLSQSDLVGKNPFTHYAQTGNMKGQNASKSRQKRVRHFQSKPVTKMRAAAVAMVRNEADIIGAFTSHLLALFDDIVIVDHQSDDGTAEYLSALAKQFPQVRVLTLQEPSYIQSVAMTHVMRDIACVRNADWVFILDADEFLPFQSRADFLKVLDGYRGCPAISMRWRNVIPVKFWSDVVEVNEKPEFFVPPAFSPFKKVAFQPRGVNIEQTMIAQGNHALIAEATGEELRSFDAKFHLRHIPVRSVAQLSSKLRQGVRSYQLLGAARDDGQGVHWHRMTESVSKQTLTDGHLNAMVVNYSEELQALEPVGHENLLALGYARERLEFAKVPTGLNMVRRPASGLCRQTQIAQRGRVSVQHLRTCGDELVSAGDTKSGAGLAARLA